MGTFNGRLQTISLLRELVGGYDCGWMVVSGCLGHSSESPGPTTLPSESNPQSDGLGGKLTVSDFISQQAALGPGAGLQFNKERTVCLKVVCVCTFSCSCMQMCWHLDEMKKNSNPCTSSAATAHAAAVTQPFCRLGSCQRLVARY